jgi:GPH family glycoside/pentoside/hexuronide:cation symporter
MGVMGAAAAALFRCCFFTTTERLQHKVEKTPVLRQTALLFRNDQWLVLCGVCVIGTIGYVIRGAVAAYYAKYYLGGDAVILSRFLATGVVAAILAMVASTWITKRWCKIQMFRWTQLAVGVISAVLFFAVKPGDLVLAFVLYFLLSFVVDLHAPVFWSAIAEAIDYGENKLGERVSGLAWGGISFCQQAGMGLGGAIVGWLLTYYDYVPDQVQSEFTLNGIALMLSVIPGVFHFGMGLLMFKYRITDRFYRDMVQTQPAPAAPVAQIP